MFKKFIIKAKKQDKRNKFNTLSVVNDDIPAELKDFYLLCNPVDVEVKIKELIVKFYEHSYLNELQKEYNKLNGFVFATCNGDPIYIKNNQVYRCLYENAEIIDEFLADSFQEFLDLTC